MMPGELQAELSEALWSMEDATGSEQWRTSSIPLVKWLCSVHHDTGAIF